MKTFYGDSAFDVNDLFNFTHSIGAGLVIKIRKNASTDRQSGSKHRISAIREYREKGHGQEADDNNHGMRWPGTEDIFSAGKRTFEENCASRSTKGLEAEGHPG